MRNQNTKGYFSVHRTMLNHWLFEDATEIGLWVTFASEFAYEECEVKGKFTGKPIKLKPNQQVFSTKQLIELLNGVWPGTKSGKKQLTRHMVNHRMDKWKGIGLIDWIDCECTTDGRLFTIKKVLPNAGNSEAVSETKPAAPNIKKNSSSSKTKADSFVLPSNLDTPPMKEAWDDFIVHRKETGKKLTGQSAKMVLNKLLKANLTPDEAVTELNKAVECGWKTVFPKKPEVKVVKRTGKSSYTPAGPEALMYHDKATTKAATKLKDVA